MRVILIVGAIVVALNMPNRVFASYSLEKEVKCAVALGDHTIYPNPKIKGIDFGGGAYLIASPTRDGTMKLYLYDFDIVHKFDLPKDARALSPVCAGSTRRKDTYVLEMTYAGNRNFVLINLTPEGVINYRGWFRNFPGPEQCENELKEKLVKIVGHDLLDPQTREILLSDLRARASAMVVDPWRQTTPQTKKSTKDNYDRTILLCLKVKDDQLHEILLRRQAYEVAPAEQPRSPSHPSGASSAQ